MPSWQDNPLTKNCGDGCSPNTSLRTCAKSGICKLSVCNEAVLDGILFVQQTGVSLEDIPQVLGYGGSMTCERCLAEAASGDAGAAERT